MSAEKCVTPVVVPQHTDVKEVAAKARRYLTSDKPDGLIDGLFKAHPF
jgi:hypothetical protein